MTVTVADNVRAEMVRQRVTGQELAARIGMTQTRCSRRVRGALAWTADELLLVATALGVDVADFYRGVGVAAEPNGSAA